MRLPVRLLPACLLALFTLPVHANSITVNNTTDEETANGLCSLREAVIAANTDTDYNGCVRVADGTASNDTITLPSGTYLLTVAGTDEDQAHSGDLDVLDALSAGTLTIAGSGRDVTIIDGNAADRVFDLHDGANLTLAGLTVQNGETGMARGGAIGVERATLLFRDGAVRNSHGRDGGGIAAGGYDMSVTLSRMVVSGNRSGTPPDNGGGIYVDPGLTANGTLLIEDSVIQGNQAMLGGGLALGCYGCGLNATVRRVTFAGNATTAGARAIVASPQSGGVINLELSDVILADGGAEYESNGAGTVTVTRNYTLSSDASLGLTGNGNLNNTDPLFMDAANGDLRLQAGSPARDTGDPAYVAPAGTFDVAGNTRVFNARVDMGAYEYGYFNVTATAGANGSISPASVTTQLNAGASFTASPATGYSPSPSVTGTCPAGSWSGNTYTTGPITADCSVNVSFAVSTYAVTVSPGTGGSAVCSPNPVSHGTAASCAVSVNAGYTLSSTVGGSCPAGSWSGNTWNTGAITASCSVSFVFTLNTYPVTVNAGTGGSAVCSPNPVNHGATTSCTVSVNPGYTLLPAVGGNCPLGSWSGNTWNTGPITAACSVGFIFAINSYPITVIANPAAGGTATCMPAVVAYGGSASCTASPSPGYVFTGWSGDCTGPTCTLDNVTGTRTVTANFQAPTIPTLTGGALAVLSGMMLGLAALHRRRAGRPGA